MDISEQIRKLKEFADEYAKCGRWYVADTFKEAADTIEALSAKLQAANIDRSAEGEKTWRYCEECEHYTPMPSGARGGKRGHCEKRYPKDLRSGRARACKMFSEKDNVNES